MLSSLLVAHVAAILAAHLAGRRSMSTALFVAGAVPALTTLWAIVTLVGDQPPSTTEFTWVEGLDLTLRFRTDALALLMVLLVSGIGALVFVYATGYFSSDAPGATRFPATLLAFSASMLGLVVADSIWTLFIFWELTSITSFLLVGHKHPDAAVRTAARRALLITGGGGLALLAGLITLAQTSGTSTLTDLVPVDGTQATVAAALIMIGAATKSAQVPFHVWLPGAMAAPTPVSAYLHSATMVKAGVLLIAVLGPAFAEVAMWNSVGLAFGVLSMIWGAVGALRHRDAKLILAWGTVSQLGLLVILLSVGTAKAVFAAVSLLFAHALFKAALFMVVGEIDVRTGTRDITRLGGLRATMPVGFAVAALAGLSMMGAPPLLGFMAKEAAIEAVLGLSGAERAVALSAVVGGSVLTVAYTTRLLIGLFGSGPAISIAPTSGAMTVPSAVLAAAGVAGFLAAGTVNDLVRPAAVELQPDAEVYSLLRWPGVGTAFVISVAIILAGLAAGWQIARRPDGRPPRPLGADGVDRALDGLLDLAPRLTARVQHGSLPIYLATMASVVSLAALPFLADVVDGRVVRWDHPVQAALASSIVGAAITGAVVRSRLGAALTLGAVGLGVTGLFVVHGAPDLALTQLLVETVIVVGFVIGLRPLSSKFPTDPGVWRLTRLTIAILGGLTVSVALVASSAAPTGRSPVEALVDGAVEEGGGNNIVNVILTDIRALDTLGEVVVLATVAIGILALGRTRIEEASS